MLPLKGTLLVCDLNRGHLLVEAIISTFVPQILWETISGALMNIKICKCSNPYKIHSVCIQPNYVLPDTLNDVKSIYRHSMM